MSMGSAGGGRGGRSGSVRVLMNRIMAQSSARARLGVGMTQAQLELLSATALEREDIYCIRHDVYARELGQHPVNGAGRLRDALDDHNHYVVAKINGVVVGFISITPPTAPSYSMDKYVARELLPFAFDDGLYELRLLTVTKSARNTEVATLLMHAALRWVDSHGGTRIMAIGRQEILDMYLRAGLESVGIEIRSGAVTYQALHASMDVMRARSVHFAKMIAGLEAKVSWKLSFPFQRPAGCFHGGAFFDAIGTKFDTLERREEIVNADVLDAWFPPSPRVIAKLQAHLPWLLQTSPPTSCDGLIEAIATARGVLPCNILPGAGSSDLIFRAFRHWLTRDSRALILDPTYGEYAHVLEQVIGCTVDRFPLHPADGFAVDLEKLSCALERGYDLVVLVNPNSPTGCFIQRERLQALLNSVSERTRVWVDETYVEYAGVAQSIEKFAAQSENVIVCKSMSKVYALSGVRAGYLCAGAHQLEALRALTPPWVVSLPAQVAAVEALADPEYYAARYVETHQLRAELEAALRGVGLQTFPGVGNFVLCELPTGALECVDAATLVARCRERGVFIRDASGMGRGLGGGGCAGYVRIAVKDAQGNARVVEGVRASRGCPR